ncbi:hypothetical protein, partial [Leptolyngbya sp. FACHB-541]|uniref:hypothetical protein n=1 Tax=Leptolyngbya sp. FACHB-541 TaxID=2692810 RepID=UPI001A7E592F
MKNESSLFAACSLRGTGQYFDLDGRTKVVSQKRVNGKVGKLGLAFFPSDVYSFFVQVAAFFAPD